MEEVPALATCVRYKQVWHRIIKALKDAGYTVYWKILGCKDFYIPQSRRRLYVVGLLNPTRQFQWPEPRPDKMWCLGQLFEADPTPVSVPTTMSTTNLRNLETGLRLAREKGLDPACHHIVIDLEASKSRFQWRCGVSPLITKARARRGYYISSQGRRMCIDEMFRLFGIPPHDVPWQAARVSKHQIRCAIGNAFPVNVMACLISPVLFAAGVIDEIPKNKYELLGVVSLR